MSIKTTGTSRSLFLPRCWIKDHRVQQGVNSGYYIMVLVLSVAVSGLLLWQMKLGTYGSKRAARKRSTLPSVLGLLLLHGLTWGVVLLSDQVFAKLSFFIFTILNSFEGMLLHIPNVYL